VDHADRRHRAGAIEAALVSLIQPGETALVVNFGRFGLLFRKSSPASARGSKRSMRPGAKSCRWRPSARPRCACSRA
jgi:hypothetical protein